MNQLKTLREQKGLGQKELAAAIKVSQPTISDWENGRKTPSAKSTAKLADYFQVTVDYLLGRCDHPQNIPPVPKKSIKIPVLGKVQAGIPIEAIEDILDYEEIPQEWTHGGAEFFALQIRGNSMEPHMKEGDVVIVRRQNDVDSGNIAVVLVKGESATVKKIKKQTNGILLVSFNLDYEPMFFSNQQIEDLPVTILGRVIESRGKW